MIDQMDERLLAWARKVVPDVAAQIAPPPDDEANAGVRIHLLTIQPVNAPRGARRPPLELTLSYLVTTFAADARDAHRWLGTLAFEAMSTPEWQVADEPLPVDVWRAFGVPPRPSFVVRMPVRFAREEHLAPPVRSTVLQLQQED
ncbi:MAG TPA: hypothetical protein VGF69_00010 [Thermoanaerobaculia bacterium]|jgi:hypothetical protein